MMLRYLSEVVEGVEMPTRPRARVDAAAQSDQASVSSAHAKAVVGAGSDQAATRRRACWNPRTKSCHMCAQGNPQDTVGQATCRTMESLDELWQGLPEYCAPSRGIPLGPETAPVDAAKTRWLDDAPENICC